MRLIDADALKEATKAHGEKIAYVVSFLWDVDAAPTIAAIPVEWINTLMLDGEPEESKSAWRVLKAWKREQEAHDVRTQAAHD